MILLDTNVVSELRRASTGRIDPNVAAWTASIDALPLSISVLTIMELRKGVLAKQRHDPAQATVLERWLDHNVRVRFQLAILPVDDAVAERCAALHVPIERAPIDALIAATALVHNLTLATRNVRDFAGTGVRLVNPWDYRVGTGSAPE